MELLQQMIKSFRSYWHLGQLMGQGEWACKEYVELEGEQSMDLSKWW